MSRSPRSPSPWSLLSALVLPAFATAAACKPDLDQSASVIGGPVVLAVRSDPAEAAPMTGVTYSALYVDRSGRRSDVPVQWAYCNARKPLAELGPVNTKCLDSAGEWFVPVGVGTQVSGTLPAFGCRLFGPDVPQPVDGQPPGRPVDPDATGGYYQPLRLIEPADGTYAIGIAETRISCALAGALGNVAVEFAQRYHANVNPAVLSLEQTGGANPGAVLPTSDHGAINVVPVGARVGLRAAWSACPAQDLCGDGICGPDETFKTCAGDCPMSMTPGSCPGAERYAAFDLASQAVIVRREAITAAWFATDGSFESDTTGREAGDPATTTDNAWRAPATPGRVVVWVVLRDDRGGTGWSEYAFDVK